MASYIKDISFENAFNIIKWPFLNEKNFFNFTVPTISYLAMQRFSNYYNNNSDYYSAGAFITAGAAFIAFQLCKCIDLNISKSPDVSQERAVRVEELPDVDPLKEAKRERKEAAIAEAARKNINNIKPILHIVNTVSIKIIFSPFIEKNLEEIDKDTLSNDQKIILAISEYFGIPILTLNTICKKNDVCERFELFLKCIDKRSLNFLFLHNVFDDFLPEGYNKYLTKKKKLISVRD